MGPQTCFALARLSRSCSVLHTAARSLCVQNMQTRGKASSPISASDESFKSSHQDFDPFMQKIYDKLYDPNGPIPKEYPPVKGYDFNEGINYEKLFSTYENVGHQATFLGKAINVLNGMIDCKLSPINLEEAPSDVAELIPGRPKTNCTIFLGYTSNMISSGTREILRYLVQHNMVDCIVSTAGGIEEDIMKCMGTFHVCDFRMDDKQLAIENLPRNGNIMVPGGLYEDLDNFLTSIVEDMMHEQNETGVVWTPSDFIRKMGQKMDNPESLLYWAARNNIPILCPAITDGGIGDSLYFHAHKYGKDSLRLDIVQDYRKIIDMIIHSVNTGSLNLGAGITKHHILNTNSFRDGLDFAVYVNTAMEFDGSDAGAPPDEAVSWAKIQANPKMPPVKVATDASIALPIMVAGSFAKRQGEFEDFYAN